jgi:ATP-binding protein involved in chromosome partitioning
MSISDQVLEALSRVQDPELRRSITELDMVQDLKESQGQVSLTILLTIAA